MKKKTVLLVPLTLTDEKEIEELEALQMEAPEDADYWMVAPDGFKAHMVPEAYINFMGGCWTLPEEALPITDDIVLISLSGTFGHVHFDHAYELASYDKDGWLFETYLEADPSEFTIHAWMPLPPAYGAEERWYKE